VNSRYSIHLASNESGLGTKCEQEFFYQELKKAKEVVSEPLQPRIRLKVGGASEAPPSGKKITIHVPGRGGSADSSMLPTTDHQGGEHAPNGTAAKNAVVPPTLNQLDRTHSTSASVASPNPSIVGLVKREDSRMSPAQPNATSAPQLTQTNGVKPHEGTQNGILPPAAPVWNNKFRQPGQGASRISSVKHAPTHNSTLSDVSHALISHLKIQTHPGITGIKSEKRIDLDIPPSEHEAQQSIVVNLAPEHPSNLKIQIIPTIPTFLQEQDRYHTMWVMHDGQVLYQQHPHGNQNLPQNSQIYVADLHAGVNRIEVHVFSPLPKGQTLANGAEVELEIFTVLFNVMRN
jgi:hypothetical protein